MRSAVLSRLFAAEQDGRTQNVRYRQDQLLSLHRTLVDSSKEICTAIAKDSSYTNVEAEAEFAVGMQALRQHYELLDFEKSLSDEYQVVVNHEYVDRCYGAGMVYIRPGSVSPFFSILTPLAAALSAGNCVILELGTSLLILPVLLRKILPAALDPDTFAIVESFLDDEILLSHATFVIQAGDAPSHSKNVLQSSPSTRVVAVVDRTADISLAAKQLVQARFAFAGRSCYAPDLVLVNEFVKKSFLEAVAKESVAYLDIAQQSTNTSHRQIVVSQELLSMAVSEGSAELISLGSRGCVVNITSRKSSLLSGKIQNPMLAVLSCTSLDDAIDFANSRPENHSVRGTPYLAAYAFGKPATAKYIGQFINAQASFLNTIPAQLLVGPAAPSTSIYPVSVYLRYTKSMFEVARPQYTIQSTQGTPVTNLIVTSADDALKSQYSDLVKDATRPLKSTGQPLQTCSIGFFEQGILIGLTIAASPIVLGLGFAVYFGTRLRLARLH